MSAVKVVYSIGVRFAAGGIGDIAYHGVRALHDRRLLKRLLCGSFRQTEIPDRYIRQMGLTSRVMRRLALLPGAGSQIESLHNRLYDQWAASRLEPCDVFVSWNGFGLRSMREARRRRALTFVYRASSHPREQARILAHEGRRWATEAAPAVERVERAANELREADYVVVPSDYARETCINEGIEPESVITIPFGVDTSRFKPPSLPVADEPFRVLFLGQIGWRKGVHYLLQAWQCLDWQDAELWLVGRVQAEFKRWLRPFLELPGVRLVGHADDPAYVLRQCHLFVFPTLEEGSALVIYEAMASGLPVITTPNAGSLIQHEHDGILTPIRDVEQLAVHMAALRADAERRRMLGMAARRSIEPFTWSRYGEAFAGSLLEKGKQVV